MSWFGALSQVVHHKTSRRRGYVPSSASCETLEVRQMLSATAVQIKSDTAITSSPAFDGVSTPQAHTPTAHHTSQSEGTGFVKPWQGTWDIFSDIPFVSDGTVTFNQTSTASRGTSAILTGLSDATVKKVRVVGDLVVVLQLRVFNDISNRTVNVTTSLVLDPANMLNFQGDAKVQGGTGGHTHSFWGQRLSGPNTAMVELDARAVNTTQTKHDTFPAFVGAILTNHGDAPVPQGGAQLLIEFGDNFNVESEAVQIESVTHRGFASVTPTVVDGHTAFICILNSLLNSTKKTTAFVSVKCWPYSNSGDSAVTFKLTDVSGYPIVPELVASGTFH